MTSVLNVDTIADKAGTGPVGLTKQQAAKVFCSVDQTSSTHAVNGGVSFNVTSVLDDGDGQTDIAITSAMASNDYNFVCGKGRTGGQNGGAIAHTNNTEPTASLFRIIVFKEDNSAHDDARANVTIFGDLA